MRRLIAKKRINITNILSDTTLLDNIMATNLIESKVLNDLLKNKSLSSGEIIDKILKSKLIKVLSLVYKQLLDNDNIKEELQKYDRNDVIITLRKYLRDNIRNKQFIYERLNIHLYNVFHSDDSDDNITPNDDSDNKTKDDFKEIDISNINSIEKLKEQFNEFPDFNSIYTHAILQSIVENKNIKQFIYTNKNLDISDLMDKFNQLDHTDIANMVFRILCNHFSTEEKAFIGDDTSNTPITKVISDYINNNRSIQFKIAPLLENMIKNIPADNKEKDLNKLTMKDISKLPTLKSMERINDNINDTHNISLLNYYNSKIVISADGKIKYFVNTNDQTYINELKQNNINYAIGTMTSEGVVCIHDYNMNINDIINIAKTDPTQIKKVYILDKQHNLAVQITRKAKLLYVRRDKRTK